MYTWASVDSTNEVAPPTTASIHIQNTAPGPPIAMAMATPATLPVPTREAAETVNALKAEMFFSPFSAGVRSTIERNMSGMNRIWTTRVVQQK